MENADPALGLFTLCEGMKWAHLPVAGGLYDQHPVLLEKFRIIFQARSRKEAREQAKRDAEQKRGTRGSGGRGRRR